MEIWKNIPNIDGYQASNYGRLKSIDRFVKPGRGLKTKRFRKGQILKLATDINGYLECKLGADRKGFTRKVHRIVMMAFVGISNLEVNHKDGNKKNNHIDNLEYATHSENHIHCRKVLKKLVGKNHWRYKNENTL